MKKSTEIEPADHATGSSVVAIEVFEGELGNADIAMSINCPDAIQALRKSETHSRRAADVAWLRMELENDA